jgi:hypothetical protein
MLTFNRSVNRFGDSRRRSSLTFQIDRSARDRGVGAAVVSLMPPSDAVWPTRLMAAIPLHKVTPAGRHHAQDRGWESQETHLQIDRLAAFVFLDVSSLRVDPIHLRAYPFPPILCTVSRIVSKKPRGRSVSRKPFLRHFYGYLETEHARLAAGAWRPS